MFPGRWSVAPWLRAVAVLSCAATLACAVGCEVDSFLDPSVVGRWERTPVVLPILDRLDVIDEPRAQPAGLSPVQPDDLVADIHEYVIGPGDLLTVSIFELLQPNVESLQARRVDALGMIRLPVVGPIKAEGQTPSQLEDGIKGILKDKGVLLDATVSVLVQESRQNQFSVIGEPRVAGTAIGAYTIIGNDFRLMDAMAMARGVSGGIKKLYVIRQVPLLRRVYPTGGAAKEDAPGGAPQPTTPPQDPARLIEDLLKGIEPAPPPKPPQPQQNQPKQPGEGDGPAAAAADVPGGALLEQQAPPRADDNPAPNPPDPLEGGLTPPYAGRWVNVDGKWVRLDQAAAAPGEGQPVEAVEDLITQRIIEVPYDKLLDGDMRYNIVIRPGDIIRVPPPVIGNVYIGGAITRPGTFQLPGDLDLTLKQLVFAAGNLSPLAIPERVDLIRRVGKDQEATVRIDLRAIFDGRQPDFFLKPNDTINVGTSFFAAPLAVARNGFRTSYGFGFIFDRNFGFDVFGPTEGRR